MSLRKNISDVYQLAQLFVKNILWNGTECVGFGIMIIGQLYTVGKFHQNIY